MKRFYNIFYSFIFSLLLLWISVLPVFSQCDATTPSFIVDLSNNPDSVWIETNTSRLDSCCFQQDADPCITFIVTLPPNVGGLYFSVENPQPAIASSQFHINCDSVSYSVQDTVCVAGYTPPYVITYCKPGNDRPDYIIAGIGSGEVSPPITVSDACTDTIYGTGFKESTITWTSYPYNPLYQSYLSDSVAEDTVIVTPSGIYPDSLQYIICGELSGLNCSAGLMTKCDTTTVYFVTNFFVDILPQDPTICFGGGPVTLSANASGGASPYSYLWSTGATTQSINVSSGNAGLYWVEVKDTLECAGVRDTVTVTEFFSSIDANAGTDLISCFNNPSVTLNGTVQAASGGAWTGGTGIFSPDDSALNASYTPDSIEISNGQAVLFLTTTGNGSCPADVDTVEITINPDPVVDAGINQAVCATAGQATLAGTVTGGSSTGKWTGNGSGIFTPNDSSLNADYVFSASDITNGFVTLHLNSTNNGQCSSVADSVQITIDDPALVNAGPDQVLCKNNADATLGGAVSGISATGQWSSSGTGSFFPSDSDLAATYIPSSSDTSTGIIFIMLSSTNNGVCNAVTDTLQINFNPSPSADAGNDQSICGDGTVSLNGIISIATGSLWTSSGSGSFSPNDSSLNTNYFPSSADTATGTVEIIISTLGNGNCLAVTDTVQINITDVPSVEAGPDQTLCANNAGVALNGIASIATGGVWTSNGSGTFTPSDSLLTTTYYPSTSDTAAGQITIFLSTTGNGLCNAVSDSLQIIFTPAPLADAGADIFVCKTNPDVALGGSVSTATGGTWSTIGDGNFVPDANDLNATYSPGPTDISNGNVTLTLTSTGNGLCNSVSDDVLITYTTDSISLFAGNDTTVCSAFINLNGTVYIANGGVWSSDGSGTFSPNDSVLNANYTFSNADTSAGTVTLTLTTTGNGGCAAKSDTIVVSLADPIYVSASAPDSICGNGDPIPVSALSTTASGVWSTLGFGTFTPNDTTLNVAYIPGSLDISDGKSILVFSSANNNGCASVTDTIIVNFVPAPFSDFTADSVCLNNTTTFTDASSSVGTIISWIWDFGDGNSDSVQNTSNTYSTDSNYSVMLITESNFGCIDTIINIVPVHPLPQADFATAAQCFADSVFFNDLTSINSGTIVQWQWDFGDGTPASSAPNPTHQYTMAGTYTITLATLSDFGCSDSLIKTVSIQPAPVAAFSNSTACVNKTVFFTNSTTISTGNVISWAWDFGDGNSSNLQDPAHTYSSEGTYSVQLIAISDSGCSDTAIKAVSIFPAPIAAFTSNAQCYVDSVFFTDGSSITSGSLSYYWNFGDGDSSNLQNPSHFYQSAGIYPVTLVVLSDSGCADSVSKNISVNPSPVAAFVNTNGCFGTNTQFVDSTVLSSGNIISWNWDFGDGNSSGAQNPSHLYPGQGTYIVQLIVSSDSGCTDTAVKQITVYSSPVADFSSSAQCFVDSVFFTDGSTINSGNIVSFYWTFGDGDSSNVQYPSHFYFSAGGYSVTLVVVSDSGCSDAIVKTVSVNPAPTANFGNNQGCLGNITIFSDSSTISTGSINDWFWDFGDGSTGTVQNPGHTYTTEGSYTVQLIAVSDSLCRDTIEKLVEVYPLPQAGFENSAQCFVDSVFFTDISSISNGTISQWLWNFGDGNSSPLQHPSHFYSSLGNYTVTLVVISAMGCSDTISQSIAVAPAPAANFIMSTGTVCLNQSILFVDISTISSGNIVSWNWNFGDGSTASSSNVFHSYSISDTFTIVLTVTSNLGCEDTASLDVIAYPSPLAAFSPNGYCINEGTVFFDSSSAFPDTIVSWQWYFGDGSSAFTQTPFHYYQGTGNYGVSLIVATIHGCKDTITEMITINPAPSADFSANNYFVLTGDPINFSNNSSGGSLWEWDFGDSSGTSTSQNPSYTYSTGGSFIVMLIAANDFNCRDTAIDSVIINVPPKVPNGFSPNGDGKNDLLYPLGGPYKQVEFKIFNNWGELIYLSTNPDEGWNGTRNGVEQPIGVYVYTLRAITEDNKEHNLHGDVTLLR